MKYNFQIYEEDNISGIIQEAGTFEGTLEEAFNHIRLTGELLKLIQ